MADNNTTYIGGHYVASVIGVIGIIGVIVNFITIIALLRHKALRQNASTAFVINLSISDLIYAFSGLPLFIIRYWSDGKINNDFLCYMDALYHIGHLIRCILSMMAITINRYILICKPTIYAKLFSIRNTVIYLVGIWMISILQLVPTTLKIWGQAGRSTENGTCKIMNKNGNPIYFMIVFNGVVPIMIIIFCYIRIYKKVEIRDNNESTNMPTDIKAVKINLITIIALLRQKALRQNASTAFVINLSISDLIYAFSGLPIFIIWYWSDGKINNDFLCYMNALYHIGHFTRCMLSMLAITLNRYILICKPTIYTRLFTIRNTVMYSIGIWIISILQLVPTMTSQWGQVGLVPENRVCTIIVGKNGNPKYYILGLNTSVPIIIIIFCYVCIYIKVKIRDNNKPTNMPTVIKTVKSSDKKNYENGSMIKLMMMMLTSFVIIYFTLPISIIIDPGCKIRALRPVAVIIYCTHVFINPFIFYGNNKVYRLAFKQMIYPRFPSKNTNSNQIK
ncbi:hypothetical protein HCN44_011248 [Aphidius gifuensis]|uniref:G-protein coupled receptors family 1 profile domain-containing protein n=1 Tax=Aphidius gifuensis TaxID=684658 RepID=A0A835CSI1_APHGI|nr:hypothetical protein HCN44_011248 [Aphidius gifuensis]